MFHDFKIVLDPPLRGFYTYEDDVSGKVLFESSHEEKIGWVYVFFHGYVHAQIIRRANLEHSRNHPRQYSTKYPLQEKQKETLIQTHLKLYEGHEKLHKKVRYEWPFTFNFQAERGKGDTLPTSGKYSYTYDQNPHSSVEYKVMAIGGEIGQMDDHIRTLLNPEDPLYLEEEYGKSAGLLTKLREKIGGATEQELRFVQIRPNITIDQSMTSSSSTELNIESYHLPYLAPSPEDRGHILRPDNVTFNFNIQVPRNIVIGEPFPLLLSGASKSELWNQNPPQVMLTSFKIEAWVKDFATINGREDEELKLYPIWERKHLKILVGTGGLDLGAIYGFSLAGEEIVPSFKTMLLERRYDLKAEFKIEVGGKSYSVFAAIPIEGHVLSPLVASSSQPVRSEERTSRLKPQRHLAAPISPRDTTSIKFQRTHIGRFSQQVKGVHGDHSIMEAAIAVSKILTDSGVQHVFSGDTTIELLPYIDYDPSFIPSSDDTGKLQRLFSQKGSPFQVLPFDESGTPVIELLYNDEKDSEKTTIVTFSDLQNSMDDSAPDISKGNKSFQDTVVLNPVSLFNCRLWTMANQEGSDFVGVDDIDHLAKSFTRELRQHRKDISPIYAKEALYRNPDLENSFTKIGVSLKSGKGKKHSREDEELPPYEAEAGESGVKDAGKELVRGI